MEPVTTMAYAVALSGMASIQPMTLDKCDLKAASDKQILCVLVAPPCGGIGEEVCTEDEPTVKKKTTYRKKYYTKNGRRYYRLVKQ